jgi:hypothetical protein
MTFSINLTLTYYFEALLLPRNVNSPRRCYVNNEVDSDAVLNLTLTYYFEALLLSRDVNSFGRCYVNNEVNSVTPYLT